MLVCATMDQAVAALETQDPKQISTLACDDGDVPVVFMFPGQGAQYVNMGRELYETETVFREQVDACAEILVQHLGMDLRHLLYPDAGERETAAAQLARTAITQPAIFVVEYALARLWMSWGIRPHSMVGHSIGEYVAACLAGVLALEDALALVAARGRLMQSLPGGSMLAVPLPADEVQAALDDGLALAAVNAPSMCVVSGPSAAIDAWAGQLVAQGVDCRPLHTSHAFHSPAMDPILATFEGEVSKMELGPPQIPFVSNVTGTWITAAEATVPAYWARHLRQTVRFSDGLATLLQESDAILLETGPGRTLGTLARRNLTDAAGRVVLSSMRHPRDQQSDLAFLLDTMGKLWLAGAKLDWGGFYARERRRRLPLPTYPFERQRYWVEPGAQRPTRGEAIAKQPDIAGWFYVPVWRQSAPLVVADECPAASRWLVFANETALDTQLVHQLQQACQAVTTVVAGEGFARLDKDSYAINPAQPGDYVTLLAALDELPHHILHLWSLVPEESFDEAQRRGFYSLLFLAQALDKLNVDRALRIQVVAPNTQEVIGGDLLYPAQVTALGPCHVIPQEYPHLACRYIDVDLALLNQGPRGLDQLAVELLTPSTDLVVAHRRHRRWVQGFAPLRLEPPGAGSEIAKLREGGVYLVTGGRGQIGRWLAGYLAQKVRANLVLVSRAAFPEPHEWANWLEAHDEQDPVSQQIRQWQALQAQGATLLVLQADVADEGQMQRVITRIHERFGALHGVFHLAGAVREGDFSSIQETTAAQCERQFQAKVHGTLVLEKVLRDEKLDFCLLFSSLSSVLGGFAFAAYAAANLFMDAFTHRHNQTTAGFWTSVNWDGWLPPDADAAPGETTVAELTMEPQEGLEACRRILFLDGVPQVVVSVGDLLARINKWLRPQDTPDALAFAAPGVSDYHARPELRTAFVAPRNELERSIAGIWQALLGIEQVGVYDDFFDLGGHSLLGTQLVGRLRKVFEVEVPLQTIFDAPTIADLSPVIAQKQAQQTQGQDVETILAMLETLSDEEAAVMLEHLSEDELAVLLASGSAVTEED
jgi:acyl transferase domain-containing protein